jgi:hypothetical protein
MGNVLVKYSKADWVDGGRVREKMRYDDPQGEGGQLVDAWGAPISPPKDYDAKLVKKLIRQRRLAPFYVANDPEEVDSESSDASIDGKVQKFKRNRKNRDDPELIESQYFDSKLLQESLLDCPICLLAYPRNTNYTECCKQPLCTTCFVKIKRPSSGRVITCPFCNHVNFSVCYHKPRWLAELAKEDESLRDAAIRPDPVACEAVKMQVQAIDRLRPPRSHTQPRYYYANRNSSRSSAVPGPRRYVFYEPSGAYTFYDNQYYRQAPASAVATPDTPTPSYYQHYQQQEYQRQQALRARAQEYERAQLDEAIRQSMIDSGEAAEEYARVHR